MQIRTFFLISLALACPAYAKNQTDTPVGTIEVISRTVDIDFADCRKSLDLSDHKLSLDATKPGARAVLRCFQPFTASNEYVILQFGFAKRDFYTPVASGAGVSVNDYFYQSKRVMDGYVSGSKLVKCSGHVTADRDGVIFQIELFRSLEFKNGSYEPLGLEFTKEETVQARKLFEECFDKYVKELPAEKQVTLQLLALRKANPE